MAGDTCGTHGGERLTRLRQEKADEQGGVAHHVVEHAAALQLALPEPWRMWAAVLLGRAREVGSPRRCRAARPEQGAPRLHVRREQLILQIARHEADARREIAHLARLGHVTRERLLAGEPAQRAAATLDRVHDRLDVLHARLVRSAEPERVDGWIRHHLLDGRVGAAVADVELPRERRGAFGIGAVGAPHAAHVGVADAGKGLDVEARVEAAADEADAETLAHCAGTRVFITSAVTPSLRRAESGQPAQPGLKTLP